MLTKQEATLYSNIGINKLEEMLKVPNCPFVLYVGKKKLIKRRKFEEYLSEQIEIQDFTFEPLYDMIEEYLPKQIKRFDFTFSPFML